MGDGVRVEPSQLEGKADDISTEVNDSSAFPTAPCAFAFVQTATAQVQAGAVTLRSFVASGNREASNLAIVLRTAAGVYRSVDERTRAALDHDPPLPVPSAAVPVNPPLEPPIPAIEAPRVESMPGGDTGGYIDPKAAAQIIHSGNSGPMRTYVTITTRSIRPRLPTPIGFHSAAWIGTAQEPRPQAMLCISTRSGWSRSPTNTSIWRIRPRT